MPEPYIKFTFGSPPAPAIPIGVRHLAGGRTVPAMALLDTGASICAVPRKMAETEGWIPSLLRRVRSHAGAQDRWVYQIVIEAFSREWKVEAIDSEEAYAIVGRKVLNQMLIRLDGPHLQFEILE